MAEVRALGLSLLTMGRVRLTERARGASGASNDQVHLGSFRLEVLPSLPVGTYKVQLLAGPDLTPASAIADLDVTALRRQSPGGGGQGASPPRQ